MARKSRKHLETAAIISEPESMFYNAAAYVRLSSDDRKKRGDSIETQKNIIENFIAAAPDIRLFDIYSDINATGINVHRLGFQKMLMDAECGKINCIIVKDLTRLGRNAIDSGYYLEKHLPALGVRFIAVTDGYDSIDGDGGILLPLKNMISEFYALDIGRKCRAVQQQNIRDGRFVGRMAPYGYVKSPVDCHQLLIDEEAAAIVRRIFTWAYQGNGPGEIIRLLNNEKIIPPSRYKQAKGLIAHEKLIGLEYWQIRTLKTILSDRVYVGDMVQGKKPQYNNKRLCTSPDKWVCVPNTHDPIISRIVFDRVQELILRNSDRSKNEPRKTTAYSSNVFKSKVFCGRCGHIMHRNRQNKDGTYWYRCTTQWKYKKSACVQVSVKEADLKRGIITMLQKHSQVILGKLISFDTISSKSEQAQAEAELREINKNLAKDGHMLKSLYESMVNGLITSEEFIQMKSDYEAKSAVLSNRADEIRNFKRAVEKQKAEYQDIAEAVTAAINNDNLTAEIIGLLVDKILVNLDKSFEVLFRYGDEFREVGGR